MLTFSYLKKVVLSLFFAFLASLFLGKYVFYPTVVIMRPEFQKTITESPKSITSTIVKTGRQAFSRLTEISSLFPRFSTKAAIPPPWTPSDSPQESFPKGGGGNDLPNTPPIYYPTNPPSQPTTNNPPPTTYNPPTQQPPTAPPIQPTVPPLPPVDSLTKEEQDTVDIINQRRRELGLSTLSINFQLAAAARRHSKDMVSNGFCSHTGSDGSNPWTRTQEAGYNGRVHGETVGCGYTSGQAVVDAWWNSPGHKAVLTYNGATVIGVGWWDRKQTAVVGY